MSGMSNSWDTILSPPPPPSSSNSNMPMLYYGLVVVGTAAIVLVIYNLIVVRWCTRQHLQSQSARPNRFGIGMIRGQGLENSNRNLLSSFRYKKEAGVETQEQQDRVEYECSVCLSVFEEGEEVKILPRCKHSFHAVCIDMWLYSHFDCPLCRAPVRPLSHRLQVRDNTAENSQEGLMEPVNTV